MKCQSNLSNLIKGMRQHRGWRLQNCSDQPDPVFDHLHSKKVIYFMFKLNSCVSFNAYCLLSFHWAPMRRSSYLFMCINKIPTSLFQAKKTTALSLTLLICSNLFIIPMALLQSHSSLPMTLNVFSPVLSRDGHIPQPAEDSVSRVTQVVGGLICHNRTLLNMFNFFVYRPFLHCKVAFQPVSLKHVLEHRVTPSQWQDFAFACNGLHEITVISLPSCQGLSEQQHKHPVYQLLSQVLYQLLTF